MGHRKNRKILVGKVTGNDHVDDERVHERICHVKWTVRILICYVVIVFIQSRYDAVLCDDGGELPCIHVVTAGSAERVEC
jgi:hypothetical protein